MCNWTVSLHHKHEKALCKFKNDEACICNIFWEKVLHVKLLCMITFLFLIKYIIELYQEVIFSINLKEYYSNRKKRTKPVSLTDFKKSSSVTVFNFCGTGECQLPLSACSNFFLSNGYYAIDSVKRFIII